MPLTLVQRKDFLERKLDDTPESNLFSRCQAAFFLDLATLLQTFGVILYGTFFEKALEESANLQTASVE